MDSTNKKDVQKIKNFFKQIEENSDYKKRFLHNPKDLLDEFQVSEDDLVNPVPFGQVEKTLTRCEHYAEKIRNLESIDECITNSLPEITKIIEEGFGNNFKVSIEPFSIQFTEQVNDELGFAPKGTLKGTCCPFDRIRPDAEF